MNNLSILLIVLFISACGEKNIRTTKHAQPTFCTMDTLQCPDGRWVGRTGPKCEFICPTNKKDKD